jgi:intracellular sulfur oxidation DsrE/DsrF family protein
MKILNIVESAYRATLEEQDDTVVWFTHAVKGAGADMAVLLQGNAVCYGTDGHDASGLAFGAERQTMPPRLTEDVMKLVGKGVPVFVVEEDLAERGIDRDEVVSGLELVPRKSVPKLVASYDQVWHW